MSNLMGVVCGCVGILAQIFSPRNDPTGAPHKHPPQQIPRSAPGVCTDCTIVVPSFIISGQAADLRKRHTLQAMLFR